MDHIGRRILDILFVAGLAAIAVTFELGLRRTLSGRKARRICVRLSFIAGLAGMRVSASYRTTSPTKKEWLRRQSGCLSGIEITDTHRLDDEPRYQTNVNPPSGISVGRNLELSFNRIPEYP